MAHQARRLKNRLFLSLGTLKPSASHSAVATNAAVEASTGAEPAATEAVRPTFGSEGAARAGGKVTVESCFGAGK